MSNALARQGCKERHEEKNRVTSDKFYGEPQCSSPPNKQHPFGWPIITQEEILETDSRSES